MACFLFVSGLPRSGTTALGQLLNHHPQIALGIERYKYIYARRLQTLSPELFEADRFFDITADETNITAPLDYRWLRSKFASATLIGDKVPSVFRNFRILCERLPGLSMVFIGRRPEYVAASWQARADNPADRWPDTNDYRTAVDRWNTGMAMAIELVRERPDAFIPVSYERLFSGNRDALASLLGRLGVAPAVEVDEAFAEMTADWSKRFARPPRLTPEQLDFVKTNADFRTLGEFERLACSVHPLEGAR